MGGRYHLFFAVRHIIQIVDQVLKLLLLSNLEENIDLMNIYNNTGEEVDFDL